MKDTELLFVSIQLIKTETPIAPSDIVKISVTAQSYDGSVNRSTWSVKPKNIESFTNDTYEIIKISPKTVQLSKSIEDVIKFLKKKYGTAKTLVMWNREDYEVLHSIAKQCRVRLSRRVVILQEIIEIITENHTYVADMETALEEKSIEYNKKQLHNTVVNIEYLYKLYNKLYTEYKTACADDKEIFCKSVKGNIIHHQSCVYTGRIVPHNYATANLWDIFIGAAVCKRCAKYFGKLNWVRNSQYTMEIKDSFDDDYVYEVCRYFGLQCSVGEGVIFVRSSVAGWRIYHNRKKVIDVYHENIRSKRTHYCGKADAGFHKQNMKAKSLYGIVKYIYNHDVGYVERLARKKSRVERLFEQLENSRMAENIEN